MLDLDIVGKQLINKASRRRSAAAKYEINGNDFHITIWVNGGIKKVLTYHVMPAMLTNSGHQNHIGNVMWIRMEEAWDAHFKPYNKPNTTILLCTN